MALLLVIHIITKSSITQLLVLATSIKPSVYQHPSSSISTSKRLLLSFNTITSSKPLCRQSSSLWHLHFIVMTLPTLTAYIRPNGHFDAPTFVSGGKTYAILPVDDKVNNAPSGSEITCVLRNTHSWGCGTAATPIKTAPTCNGPKNWEEQYEVFKSWKVCTKCTRRYPLGHNCCCHYK